MCRIKEPAALAKKYRVAIIETLRKTVEVEADNPDQAEQIAADGWYHGKYILDADDFTDVEFEAVPVAEQSQ